MFTGKGPLLEKLRGPNLCQREARLYEHIAELHDIAIKATKRLDEVVQQAKTKDGILISQAWIRTPDGAFVPLKDEKGNPLLGEKGIELKYENIVLKTRLDMVVDDFRAGQCTETEDNGDSGNVVSDEVDRAGVGAE